jgi:hypothetical protein
MAEKMQGLNIANLMQGLASGVDLLTDKKTKTKTSGGTTTQTSGLDISEVGRNKLIEDALASNSGLAETSSGQRRAGLYNSSTNQLLVNDLIDRVSASVDRDTAKQVTTTVAPPTTSTQVTPARVGLGDAALGIGGAMAAKKIYDIFSDAGTIENVASGAGDVASIMAGSGATDFLSSVSGVSDVVGGVGGALDFGGFNLGLDLLSGEPEDALASGAGFLIGNALLPGIGGPIGSILSGIIPFDDIIGGLGDVLGGLFGGSVVCTELLRQGVMSKDLYVNDVMFAHLHMSDVVLTGYRYWGIPVVRLMRRSRTVTAIAAFFAVNRAHYIASITGAVAYSKPRAVLGAVINTIGVPACYVLGTLLNAVGKTVATSAT